MDKAVRKKEEPTSSLTRRMADELRWRVIRGRRRWKLLILLEATGLAVAVPLAYLWLVFLIDNVIHLDVLGRLVANAIFLIVVVLLTYRLVRCWKRVNFTEDQVALAMERRTPGGLENRLINSIQLSRDTRAAATAMSADVVEENYQFLRQVQLRQSPKIWPAVVHVLAAALLVAGGFAFWASERTRFTNAAKRIFLPFANIAPIYRTMLTVEPGDALVPPGQDVKITIRIEGRVPSQLAILTDRNGERTSKEVAVEPGTRELGYAFESVRHSMRYAVRGGDFTTRFYRITVPKPLELRRVTAVYHYPQYTRLADRELESTTGDLEALAGTRASVTFSFNQPLDEAWMLIRRASGTSSATSKSPAASSRPTTSAKSSIFVERVALRKVGLEAFAGELVFKDVVGYQLASRRATGEAIRTAEHTLRVTADQLPELKLTGLDPPTEAEVDAVLPLRLEARDDYGLAELGLFYRHAKTKSTSQPAVSTRAAEAWKPVKKWAVEKQTAELNMEYALPISTIDVAEGDEIELVVRARDTNPTRSGVWTTGVPCPLLVSGSGAALQITYERLLQTEIDLERLIKGLEKQIASVTTWIRKLDPTSGSTRDNGKTFNALTKAVQDQAQRQSQLRREASEIAQNMAAETGSLRVGVGMLADTEMVRAVRILEAVPKRENLQSKRAALADARLTHERCVRSLREILEKHIRLRKDWELSHMLAFTKMLAERQNRMADTSAAYARMSEKVIGPTQRKGVSRRQLKLLKLAKLAQRAFGDMVQYERTVGSVVASAFKAASESFDGSGVKAEMQQADQCITAGKWVGAEGHQRRASAALAEICRHVRKAQVQAAQNALADLKELAESDVEIQKEIKKLRPGSAESLVELDPEELQLDDWLYVRKLTEELKNRRRRARARRDEMIFDFPSDNSWDNTFDYVDANDQGLEDLELAVEPGLQESFTAFANQTGDTVEAQVRLAVDDLIGDLLDEAEDLRDQYETYNVANGWNMPKIGGISKQAGGLSSTAAGAATGNIKPPTHDFGGVARAGRLGARAHGLVVGDELINRRGRDQALDGQGQVADQEGEMKETLSEDPQKDESTGVGGKSVRGNRSSFSVKDEGQWKDKMTEKLGPPQGQNQIVERKGKPLNARVAAVMRDLQSSQEQVIQRIKAVRKKLDTLYLPTDHLDDIMKQLTANLDRLRTTPQPDVCRRQIELLDQLKNTVIVFNLPSSEYEQSLPRKQAVRGSVLDEPAWPTIPGYEAAVKRYYEKLSGQ